MLKRVTVKQNRTVNAVDVLCCIIVSPGRRRRRRTRGVG